MTDNIHQLYQVIGADDITEDGSIDYDKRPDDFEIVLKVRLKGVDWYGDKQVLRLGADSRPMTYYNGSYVESTEFDNSLEIPIARLQLLSDRIKNGH